MLRRMALSLFDTVLSPSLPPGTTHRYLTFTLSAGVRCGRQNIQIRDITIWERASLPMQTLPPYFLHTDVGEHYEGGTFPGPHLCSGLIG